MNLAKKNGFYSLGSSDFLNFSLTVKGMYVVFLEAQMANSSS